MIPLIQIKDNVLANTTAFPQVVFPEISGMHSLDVRAIFVSLLSSVFGDEIYALRRPNFSEEPHVIYRMADQESVFIDGYPIFRDDIFDVVIQAGPSYGGYATCRTKATELIAAVTSYSPTDSCGFLEIEGQEDTYDDQANVFQTSFIVFISNCDRQQASRIA
jgi:hypothetical protein